MKTLFNDLKARNILSEEQMQNVKGGSIVINGSGTGTCAVYSPNATYNGTVHANGIEDSGRVLLSLSKADALAAIAGIEGARWCCDSCGSASWM